MLLYKQTGVIKTRGQHSSGAIKYHTTSANMTTYTYADNRTAAELLATITGNVNGSGNTVTSC